MSHQFDLVELLYANICSRPTAAIVSCLSRHSSLFFLRVRRACFCSKESIDSLSLFVYLFVWLFVYLFVDRCLSFYFFFLAFLYVRLRLSDSPFVSIPFFPSILMVFLSTSVSIFVSLFLLPFSTFLPLHQSSVVVAAGGQPATWVGSLRVPARLWNITKLAVIGLYEIGPELRRWYVGGLGAGPLLGRWRREGSVQEDGGQRRREGRRRGKHHT